MGKTYKIIVTGAFNSGKTEFVSSASTIPVVSTERKITDEQAAIKEETTVALDYGQTSIEGNLLHLFGTPGQPRFNFMKEILSQDADGLLLLVDSTDRTSINVARQALRSMGRRNPIPFLIVATKQDTQRPISPEEIASALKLDTSAVVPCDARKKASTKRVLQELLTTLP